MENDLVLVIFGSFLGLLLLGAPIVVALAAAALAGYWTLGIDPISMVQTAYTSVCHSP